MKKINKKGRVGPFFVKNKVRLTKGAFHRRHFDQHFGRHFDHHFGHSSSDNKKLFFACPIFKMNSIGSTATTAKAATLAERNTLA